LTVTLEHELSESENLVISSLLSISENFHVLLEDNQRDKLTGLLNRKTFEDSIYKIQEIIAFTPDERSKYRGNEENLQT
jgi:GGDEF domain-containing protein